jgi:hypothetical protein
MSVFLIMEEDNVPWSAQRTARLKASRLDMIVNAFARRGREVLMIRYDPETIPLGGK